MSDQPSSSSPEGNTSSGESVTEKGAKFVYHHYLYILALLLCLISGPKNQKRMKAVMEPKAICISCFQNGAAVASYCIYNDSPSAIGAHHTCHHSGLQKSKLKSDIVSFASQKAEAARKKWFEVNKVAYPSSAGNVLPTIEKEDLTDEEILQLYVTGKFSVHALQKETRSWRDENLEFSKLASALKKGTKVKAIYTRIKENRKNLKCKIMEMGKYVTRF